MQELSDERKAERDELVSTLTTDPTAMNEAVVELNKMVDALNEKVQQYNNTLKNAKDFRDKLVGEMQDFYDGEPEKWQESDEGTEYQDWIDGWKGIDLRLLELVEHMEYHEPEHAGLLGDQPDSPE